MTIMKNYQKIKRQNLVVIKCKNNGYLQEISDKVFFALNVLKPIRKKFINFILKSLKS